MQKEFIPYEQALELKELGFDEECFGYYLELRNPSEGILTIEKCKNNMDGCLAPTFSQAFRWFRDKCELYHSINPLTFQILEEEPIREIRGYTCEVKWINSCYTIGRYDSYEEVELACLKKLIELAKQQS